MADTVFNDVAANGDFLVRYVPSDSAQRREQANGANGLFRFIRRAQVYGGHPTSKWGYNRFVNCRASRVTNVYARDIGNVPLRNFIGLVGSAKGELRRTSTSGSDVRPREGVICLRLSRGGQFAGFRLVSRPKRNERLFRHVTSITCRREDFVFVGDGLY